MKNQLFSTGTLALLTAFKSPASIAALTAPVKALCRTARKATFLLSPIAVLLVGGAGAVRGQSALDGFDPNANGAVRVVVAQPDGKVLIGGDFTALAPNGGEAVACNYLARLNPNGTLDTNFNPNPLGGILSIALQADGKILVGGGFNSIGGKSRRGLARLDPDTGLADSFDAHADDEVFSIGVQPDGKILVGGAFTSIGGQSRTTLARLDPVTGLADSFNPSPQGAVNSIAVQPDGKILVGGNFSGANSIGGQARNYLARLDPTTGLADSFNPNANGGIRSIAIQADGKIVVGGAFNSIGGQTRNYIARLDPATALADAFDPKANNQIYAIAIQPDGGILAGGFFFGANSIGGAARNYIARINEITGLADSFDPNVSGAVVFAIAVQYDGKIVAGGNFSSLSPNGGSAVTRNNVARLEKDGLLDRTLNLSIVGSTVTATALQPDGKILIGGVFTTVLGVTRNNMARLNTDGTLDTAFNPNASSAVQSIVVLPDGRILVGGDFTGVNSIGGATRNHIARLNATNGLADSFDPSASATVFSIVLQGDGRILASGDFTNICGQARNYLARLNPDGTLDTAFNPNPNSDVETITVQPDGKILAGGNFTSIGGLPRDRIARLDATNGMADSFDPNADSSVTSIVRGAEDEFFVGGSFTNIGGATRKHMAGLFDGTGGAIADVNFIPDPDSLVFSIALQYSGFLVAGQFTNISGLPRNRIARINGEAFTAQQFNPNANNTVSSLASQADGKILAGGQFNGTNSIGGQARNCFARLSNDTGAYQLLQVNPHFVAWYLFYASPLLTRVTFEISTNKVDYTFLGNGGDVGGFWSYPSDGDFPDLGLPTGQNLYIRARGYYSSGNFNGSGSIQETVLNAFLPAPKPRLNIQLSANSNVVLSWLTNFPGFTLESSTNLNANVWSLVTPTSVASGTNNVVTNAISTPWRFYRLRK